MGGFDLKKFMVTGGGFMIDQYNLFIISHVMHTIALSYPTGVKADGEHTYLTPTASQASVIKGLSLVGAVLGQLTFGTIGDVIGRREAFIGTLIFVVLGALLSTAIPGSFPSTSGSNIYWYLGIFQFLLGFGVGGEYPLSASVSRESSPDLKKVGYTFCMQGAGFMLGPVMFLVLSCLIFTSDSPGDMEGIWRGALFFSVIPAALLIKPRANMLPPRNEEEKSKVKGIGEVMSTHHELVDGVQTHIPSGTMWKRLFGTAFNWFIFDVSFYGNSILASDAFRLIGLGEKKEAGSHERVVTSAEHMLIIACLSLPGYLVSILTVDSLGLYKIQMLGFVAMTILFAALAIWYESLKANSTAFLAVYGLTFFFSNWGPNFTTYIVPTLLFPVDIRARCHGMSAASGKAGAAVGVFMLASIIHAYSPPHEVNMAELKHTNLAEWEEYEAKAAKGFKIVAALCTVVGILGIISTVMFTPTNPEEIAGRMEYETKEEPMACIAVVEDDDDSEEDSEGCMDMA